MPEGSNKPILESNRYAGSATTYQDLVKYTPQPSKTAYIESIYLAFNAASVGVATFDIEINGKHVVKDQVYSYQFIPFDFRGKLIVRGDIDEGIKVKVKSTGAAIDVSAFIIGIEVEE